MADKKAEAKPVEWEDCTEVFRNACKKLEPWQTCTAPGVLNSSLLSAPEILDPKTDAYQGWKETKSLGALLKEGQIADTAKLSAAEIVDIVDVLFAMEGQFMKGTALPTNLLRCVYFHRQGLLGGNKSLKAYVRAVIKAVLVQLALAQSSQIHDEEEFSTLAPPEVDFLAEVPEQEIIDELAAAIADEKDAALKSRLEWRKSYTKVLAAIRDSNAESILNAAADADAAIETLSGFKRTAALAANPKVFREEARFWYFNSIPTKSADIPKFEETVDGWKEMLQGYRRICDFPSAKWDRGSLNQAFDFFDDFSRSEPAVPLRAAMFSCIAQNDGTAMLLGVGMTEYPLAALASDFGMPIYQQIVGGDKDLVKECVAYYMARQQDPRRAGERRENYNAEQIEQMIVGSTHDFARATAELVLAIFQAMLSNRGRYHRRVANIILSAIPRATQLAHNLDYTWLCAAKPTGSQIDPVAENHTQSVRRAGGALGFMVEVLYMLSDKYVVLTSELNLNTPAELLYMGTYRFLLASRRLDNLGYILVADAQMVPPRKVNRRTNTPTVSPALYSRQMHRLGRHLETINSIRVAVGSVFPPLVALRNAKLLEFNFPEESLVTLRTVFARRFTCLTSGMNIAEVPFNADTAEAYQATDVNAPLGDILARGAKGSAEVAKRTKDAPAQLEGQPQVSLFTSLAKVSKQNFVTMSLLKTMVDKSKEDPSKAADVSYEIDAVTGIPIINVKPKL